MQKLGRMFPVPSLTSSLSQTLEVELWPPLSFPAPCDQNSTEALEGFVPASRGISEEWQKTQRFVVGLFVAYAILIQSFAGPYLRAQAVEHARLDGALGVICLSDGAPGHEEPGQRKLPHGHGLDCCLPGLRCVALDTPQLIISFFTFELPAETRSSQVDHALPQSRAPPPQLTTVLQPRAPPVSIV